MASARSSAATGRAAGYRSARDYRSPRAYRPARDYAERDYAPRARRSRPAGRRRATPQPPWTRVRWDRVGRTGLVIVLAVLVGLYVQHAIDYVSTRVQADHQLAGVQRLARANAALRKQQKSLSNPVTIKNDARVLGMVQAGELPYVVMGLPNH